MKIELLGDERGLIVGQTGSGKTYFATHFLFTIDLPCVVIDTKIDPQLEMLIADKRGKIVENDDDLYKSVEKACYTIYRPPITFVKNNELLDSVLLNLYNIGDLSIYVDELAQFYQKGIGLLNILQRGRSRKIAFLAGVQRPSWINRSILSEAQKFFMFKLQDIRDRDIMYQVTQREEVMEKIERRQFWYVDIVSDTAVLVNPKDWDKDFENLVEKTNEHCVEQELKREFI